MSQVVLPSVAAPTPKVIPTAGLSAPHEFTTRTSPDARNSPCDDRPHLHHGASGPLDQATEELALPFVGLLVETALRLVDGETRFVDRLVRAGAVGLLGAIEQDRVRASHAVAFEGEVRATMLCAMLDALLGRASADPRLREQADALVDLHVVTPIGLESTWDAEVVRGQDAALRAAHTEEMPCDAASEPSREALAKRLRARVLDPAVDRAIDALPDQERTALVHTYRHGYDVQELATTMHVSVVRAVQLRTRGFEHVRQRVA